MTQEKKIVIKMSKINVIIISNDSNTINNLYNYNHPLISQCNKRLSNHFRKNNK